MKSIYGLPLADLKIMPERMIRDAAAMFINEDPNNSFVELLESAAIFREQGLSPIFLCDEGMKKLLVTTEEALKKKFH